ncbi:MAG: hypothetical protein E4H18_03480, partial [Hyphomicrobiales bacterium]
MDAGGSIAITADGTFEITMIAGAIGAASTAGVGLSRTVLVHTDTVEAYVGERVGIDTAGTAGLTVAANSSEDIIAIGAAGGAAGTAAVVGTAVVNVLNETTHAHIDQGVDVTANNGITSGQPGISVTADDDTVMVSVAGSLAAAGTAAVGAGADVGVITKRTTAFISHDVTAYAEGNIVVAANSSEDITSVAAGISASGTASVMLDASVHDLYIETRAFIGRDSTDLETSDAGLVHANGSVGVSADDETEIDKVVGVLAVGGSAGIGAAGAVTIVDKTTEAFIGPNATVIGDGNTTGITVKTGDFNFVDVTDSFDPNAAESEGVEAGDQDENADTGSMALVGEVSLPTLNDPDDESGTAKTTPDGRTASAAETAGFDGLAVTATNQDDIEVFTMSLAGGTVGIAISAGVNVINTDTAAFVGAGAEVNTDLTGANSNQSVHIAAANDFYHVAVAGTLAVGAVGVAPAADVSVLKNRTEAYVDSGATVFAANDVAVTAVASEETLMVGFGIAAGTVGIGGAVTVLTVNNITHANIGNGAQVAAGGDVLVFAADDTKANVISGALAGGLVGIGASVGVISLDKDTSAFIDDNAVVDAKGAGTGLANILSGTISGDPAVFGTTTVHGLVVQAQSSEDIFHLTIAGGVGFVGVSGTVAVTLIDSNTAAYIGSNVQINQTDGNVDAAAEQSVYVTAGNQVDILATVVGVAGGFVGVGGAVNVGSIKNDVSAYILGGGTLVSAANDVVVNALGIKNLEGYTLSGSGGFVGIAAGVSVWSIGSTIERNYDSGENSDDPLASGEDTADGDAA